MTDGISSPASLNEKDYEIRNKGLQDALVYLEPKKHLALNFEDNKLDNFPLLELVMEVERFLIDIKPHIVFLLIFLMT